MPRDSVSPSVASSGRTQLRASFASAVITTPLLLAATASPIQEMLDAEAIADTDNPVAARYFVEQGRGVLPQATEERALEQLRTSLRRQTDVMGRLMKGMAGMMTGGEATRRVREQMQQQSSPTSMAKNMIAGALGVSTPQPNPSQQQMDQMRREMEQGFADPWIRGVEAARALEELGDVQQAGQFYVNCVQLVNAEWMKDGCLNAILNMGPRRAFVLLSWMAESAEQASFTATGGGLNPDQGADYGVVQLRGAALRGLGSLIGSGSIQGEDRERALSLLVRFADDKDHAPFFADAATGLGRAKDPRGLDSVKRLAKYRKNHAVQDAAGIALATGFNDAGALKSLRGELDGDDADRALRIATALLAAGDEDTFAWAVEVVTKRRSSDKQAADLRPRVVRELAILRTDRARQALTQISTEGAGNDWLQAWTSVALLELGDGTRLPQVVAALDKTDWSLDRAGLRTLWSRITPILNLAINYMATGGVDVRQAVQVVSGMIAAERSRFMAKATDRELLSAQLRWQVADALALSSDPAAVNELIGLLDDPELAVRMSAARALAFLADHRSLDGVVKAFALDFGAENGVARAPEIRAALLRSALLQFPDDPRTRELCRKALADTDAGVRFIAAVALERA